MIHSRCVMPILLALLTAGCAGSQGLHPGQLRDILRQEESRFIGSYQPTDTTLKTPRVSLPSLGLYLKPTGFLGREFDWTDRDREAVLAWGKKLVAGHDTAKANFVPQSSLKGDNFTELRASAARYDADLLVLIDGIAAVDRYNNYKAPLLYWTILGAYLADGTQSDVLSLARGSIWDVKTGRLLFSEESEGRATVVGPAAFVDDDQVILRARQQALGALLDLIEQRLHALRTTGTATP